MSPGPAEGADVEGVVGGLTAEAGVALLRAEPSTSSAFEVTGGGSDSDPCVTTNTLGLGDATSFSFSEPRRRCCEAASFETPSAVVEFVFRVEGVAGLVEGAEAAGADALGFLL